MPLCDDVLHIEFKLYKRRSDNALDGVVTTGLYGASGSNSGISGDGVLDDEGVGNITELPSSSAVSCAEVHWKEQQ